jgi:hypothetical protein
MSSTSGLAESGEPVDGATDAHRIRVAPGTDPTHGLCGGPGTTGVGEDEDERRADLDGAGGVVLEPDRPIGGHRPGVDAAGSTVGDGLRFLDDSVECCRIEFDLEQIRNGSGDGGGHGGR